ncbi:uncharacterized protein JN550_012789 [Neoarthrinium moseri]|uniref:uncharacterized protein n=1 Tax=Neoarthrinium moseri TaxID=1658444 RepID=UPI001FDBB9A3|nr:uncharacterized protein JN550_012789 [Neoarthrinium moseri]KAI1858339.1 hypothetical protein JN550_012789 [Neoarthrinium moseri]
MRLINVKTGHMQEFFDDDIPNYAILSHTWGPEEVTFQEYEQQVPSLRQKKGYSKIRGLCAEAGQKQLDFVWIDTCCIDKKSSSELSEAINSMFQWYKGSQTCFVYLEDVSAEDLPSAADSSFRRSRWFTRGWTLQELLAPKRVLFYDCDWRFIGIRMNMRDLIAEITGIKERFIEDAKGDFHAGVAEKLCWASHRRTTRREDEAYCLMGLFGINMPLLYGEGSNAWRRLQEEIIKATSDQSILAWGLSTHHVPASRTINRGTLLSSSALCFQGWDVEVWSGEAKHHYFMTNLGLHIGLNVIELEVLGSKSVNVSNGIALLECKVSPFSHGDAKIALPISWTRSQDETEGLLIASRAAGSNPFLVPASTQGQAVRKMAYLTSYPTNMLIGYFQKIHWSHMQRLGYQVTDYYPPQAFELCQGDSFNWAFNPSIPQRNRAIIKFVTVEGDAVLLLLVQTTADSPGVSGPAGGELGTVRAAR